MKSGTGQNLDVIVEEENNSESNSVQKSDKKPAKANNDSGSEEGSESDDNSESVVHTDNAEFQISKEKWNIILGNSLFLIYSRHKKWFVKRWKAD